MNTTMPFGKHKGKPLSRVPYHYLLYMERHNIPVQYGAAFRKNFENFLNTKRLEKRRLNAIIDEKY